MIKKTFFLILFAFAIISFGCNVAEDLIDAAIVDQAKESANDDTTTTSSSDSSTTTTTTTSSSASALISVPLTTTGFSAIIPPDSK